ncbi:hypothetical protein FA13DRAFT_1126916 [Coprinellus micaceus]|uniref:Uncharacterized protein n=1 Tax=Coprinellus micaceus TaxID=71717 RepID=A0A4Y7RK56_COPMI|nr:hypothetical protein FA13DRAFT_1126916 [Coprinellus micaceus]
MLSRKMARLYRRAQPCSGRWTTSIGMAPVIRTDLTVGPARFRTRHATHSVYTDLQKPSRTLRSQTCRDTRTY